MKAQYKWARFGGYEVSSKGDRRFSAFFAILPSGDTIEYAYQVGVKGYKTIKDGKGKPPLRDLTREQLWEAYLDLWRQWSETHMGDLFDLADAVSQEPYNGLLSDQFATSPINQARALSVLLNELL